MPGCPEADGKGQVGADPQPSLSPIAGDPL